MMSTVDYSHYRVSSLVHRITGLAVFLLGLLAFGSVARLNPDPHHDGYVLAVATAVAEGRTQFVDVFNQYGPLTSWLHSLGLLFTGAELITLRMITVVLLSFCGLLLYAISTRMRLSPFVSALIAFTWIACCPVWSWIPVEQRFGLWPWPSVVFLFEVLLAVFISLPSWSASSVHWARWIGTGLLLGTGLITRFSYGFAVLVAMCLLALLLGEATASSRARRAGFLVLGSLLPTLGFLVWCIFNGALHAYVEQSITGPAREYSYLLGFNPDQLLQLFAYDIIGFIALLAVLVLLVRMSAKTVTSVRIGLLALWIALAFVWIAASAQIFGSEVSSRIFGLITHPPIALGVLPRSLLYASVTLTVGLLFTLLVSRTTRGWQSVRRSREFWLGVIALASLVQIYPLFDIYHLWWSVPLPLLSLVLLIRLVVGNRLLALVMAGILLPILIVTALLWVRAVSSSVVSVSGGALSGMAVRPEETESVAAISSVLSPLDPLRPTAVMCVDGLISVWNSSYLPDGPDFVDWAWGTTESPTPPDQVLYCTQPGDDSEALAWSKSNGMRVISLVRDARIGTWTSFDLYVLGR